MYILLHLLRHNSIKKCIQLDNKVVNFKDSFAYSILSDKINTSRIKSKLQIQVKEFLVFI